MVFEISILLALIVLNGVLAMSELAVVSSRPARLKTRAESGDRGAAIALRLAENPGRFLSTVQIGITLVGVLSGAFSGATLGARLADALPALGIPVNIADKIGVGLVVVVVTYLSLIVGELVPKQIALSNPEAVASRVAPAMRLLSIISLPLVWLLDASGRAVLFVLGQSGRRESGISDEEIRLVMAEAAGAGVIEKAENDMIMGVMRVADRTARGLMTPRGEVEIASIKDTRAELLERFARSGHSRLPMRDGGPDDIIGVLHSRDLLAAPANLKNFRSFAMDAAVVPDGLSAVEVIERLKAVPSHMLLVYDEYGHFEGIITPMDVLGAITGGFDMAADDEPKMIERSDGSLLVSGWMPADEFAELLGRKLEDDVDVETAAGYIIDLLEELPTTGQSLQIGSWTIEIVDMDGRRIDKLLVRKTL